MLSSEFRLDENNNYPIWAYMMQHVLVSKGVLNIVQGIDVHSHSVDARFIEDVVGSSTGAGVVRSTTAASVRVVLPTTEQIHWDNKDSQAHAIIALFTKHNIAFPICLARTAKQAWDILVSLYVGQNEAKISYLLKELESKILQKNDDMNFFLAEIKDLKEQLIFAGEVILDHSLVQTVLNALPESYHTFASTWRFVTEDRPDAVKYDTLVSALYVPRIKKDLLSVSASAKLGLVVKFMDDKCTIHD
ncbi:hypothetical protein L7F22_004001 [Adiantum nelumboides]|nr:hypothetical protein [Adiantum nelumboides]